MVDDRTTNKNYPLPHPSNIASQDVERISTAIISIDSDISECSNAVDSLDASIQELDAKALRIPTELVGTVDTELQDIAPGRYIVVNDTATGFSTVEGGGGEGGKKGEILVKKSDENFDTMWMDPRAVLKKTTTIKELTENANLKSNSINILTDAAETDSNELIPRAGLSQRQITGDINGDSAYTYLLSDVIEDISNEDSDIASSTQFGRVKIGTGINVDEGTISVPIIGNATTEDYGLVQIGSGLEIENGVLSAQTYPHADHENFGTIKPSLDFSFDSNGALQLANKTEEIIYQTRNKGIVENGVISIVPTCAYYRAFITTDMLFSFDLSNFTPKADFAFDLEIVSEGVYVVNFGNNVVWDLPCVGVNSGTTIIHFDKLLGGNQFRGTLKSIEANSIRLLTPDVSADITDNYICGHNGMGWQACQCIATRDWSSWMEFQNPVDCIWYIDFMRSTYVEYLEYLNGYDNWTATYFYIEGSVDGKNWKRLLTRENVKPTTYTLDEHGFFKHYRIRCAHTQIRYFRWFGFDIEDEKYELQRVMPIMNSNSVNGFEITSSGVTSGSLYNLTNDSINSWANFETRLNGEFWVKYELAEPQSVDMIDLAARFGAESNRMPTWFKIEGSNDDESWTTILERKILTRWYQGESRQYWIYNETPYKYYKLLSIEQPTSNFSLSRFRLYQKIEGTSPRGFVPILSSASQGGYEVTASSTHGSDHWAYLAFDGNSGTRWASANGDAVGGWIQIKFPTETLCTTAWLTARNEEWYGQAPTDFTILGSVDGINFETLKTVTNQTWTQGEKKKITFFNEIPYLYYRVQAQAIQNGQGYFAFSEVNFGTELREYKRELNIYRSLVPRMSSNSENGFIATASATHVGQKTYSPWEAFNFTVYDMSRWAAKSNSAWIQIELPIADKANRLRVAGGNVGEEPDSFVLSASNDGENYTDLLDTGALIWTNGETKTWNFDNDTSYKFYKISAVNTKSAYIALSGIDLIDHKVTREY